MAILQDLQTVNIRQYISQRKMAGAAGTINKEVGLFSSAISYAQQEWGWDIVNPARGCKQKEPEGRVRWITRSESDALINAAELDSRATHLPALIKLALHTGMRKGELLELEWQRVNLQTELIYLQADHTKTARRRSIPLNKEALAAIFERANFCEKYCSTSRWVFCHKHGDRIKDVKRSFATACKRVNIVDFRFHDLRHTCAAWLVSAGVPLAEVRDLLGHRSIQMTERYAHLAPENVRAAVARIE